MYLLENKISFIKFAIYIKILIAAFEVTDYD